MVNWPFLVHDQVSILNTILINIFSNCILNKFIAIDEKDPPWMTKATKNRIKQYEISAS